MEHRSYARRAFGVAVVAAAVVIVTASAHDTAQAAPNRLPMAARLLQQPTATPDPDQVYYYLDGYTPCSLKGHHTITPQTVEEGKMVTVKVDYEFNCGTEEIKQIDVVFVVENTGSLKLNNVQGKMQPLDNLRQGMSNLVRNIDPTNGSRVGLVKYGCDNHTDPPIGSGQEHYERFRTAVQGMNGNLPGGSNPGTALRRASGELAALAKPDPLNPPSFMIVIDAGGQPCAGQPRPQTADIADACDAAKTNMATVVLIALRPSQGRLRGCNTPGWYFRSSNDNGTDLQAILEEIQERIFKGSRPYRTAYTVYPNTYLWGYEFGSGVPTEPNVTFPDLAWEEDLGNRRKASFRYEYKMRALEASAPASWVSIAITDGGIPSPLIQFLYNDGTSDQIVVPDTKLCIFRPGKEAVDCGPFVSQVAGTAVAGTVTAQAYKSPTPSSGTPDTVPTDGPATTEVPTVDPTAVVATDTPIGPDPTDTPVPPDTVTPVPPDTATPPVPTTDNNHDVYLPWAARTFGF